MEPWQRTLIKENLPSLLADTCCNRIFLAYFAAANLLSDYEIAKINAEPTNPDKAYLFYEILVTKTESFSTLIVALEQTKQGGVIQSLSTIPINRLNELRVRVLGATKPLKNVIDVDQITNIHKWTRTNLRPNLHNKLISSIFGQDPVLELVQNTIPPNNDDYIPRFLSRRNCIDTTIFKKDCPDVFVFRGAERQQIREFNSSFEIESSKYQLLKPNLTVRFILLDEDSHWEKIYAKTKHPVHLIKFEDETKTFALEKTSCFSDLLQQHLGIGNETDCKFVSETEFVNTAIAQNVKGVCICDKPGMGKSLLLANIAKEVMQAHPDQIVAFIPLKNVVLPEQIEAVNSKELILQHICALEFSYEILKPIILDDTKFELLFDGLDEVPVEMMPRVTDFLNNIGRDMPEARIYVTARPVVRQKLEETTGVVAYDILPFDEKTQCNYLVKHWQKKHNPVDENLLREYAKFCINSIRTSLKKSETDITGIPLLCKLVAENYCEQAGIYAAPGLARQIELTEHFANSLVGIYAVFMEKENMLGKTKCNYACMHQNHSSISQCDIKCQIKSFHAWQAIKLVFPKLAELLSKKVHMFPDFSEQQILSSGFLVTRKKASSPEFEFTHRTFAEFLVAEYLAKCIVFMRADDKELNSNFRRLQQLTFDWLFTFNNYGLTEDYLLQTNVVAHFLNHMILAEENFRGSIVPAFGSSTYPIPPVNSSHAYMFPFTHFAAFISCLDYNYEALTQILFKVATNSTEPVISNIQNALRKNEEIALKILQVACENCRESTVKDLCNCFRETFNFNLIKLCTRHTSPIKTSIFRAEYELAIFFFENVACKNIELLLSCVDTTDLVDEGLLDKRLEIVERLVKDFSHLLPEWWPMTLFLFGYKYKYIEIRQAISSNVETINRNGNQFMEFAQDLREMADYVLLKNSSQKMFLDATKFKKYFFKASANTPFDYNLASFIEILRQLNEEGYVSHTLLQSIITDDKMQESEENMVENLETLLSSTFFSKYTIAFSFLFFTAVMERNVKVAEMLYSHDNSLLEMEHTDRATALLLATEKQQIEMVKFLASKGANIFAKDVHGRTILHIAAETKSCEFFEYIVLFLGKQAGSITEEICKLYKSRTIEDLKTPLHYIVKYLADIPFETLELFFKGGISSVENTEDIDVDIDAVDSDGYPALHLAVEATKSFRSNKKLVQCLIDHGADLHVKNQIGWDFVTLCAKERKLELLEYCYLKGLLSGQDYDEVSKALKRDGVKIVESNWCACL